MKRIIGILFVLALFLGASAGQADALGWSDFKARLGIGNEETEQEMATATVEAEMQAERVSAHKEGIIRGIRAINANRKYLRIADAMGYDNVCLEILGNEEVESFTLGRTDRGIAYAEGCQDPDFTARIHDVAFQHLVMGLETNNPTVLADIYDEGSIDVPWTVKLKVGSKCIVSRVC